MQNKQDAMREAMRMAQTVEGQQLIRILQNSREIDMQAALQKAAAGDFDSAKQAISAAMNNPEVQKLLQKLGGTHGSDGR